MKEQFSTSTSNLGYTIPVPGMVDNEQLGVRRSRFKINAAEVKDIFDPIVDKAIKLVEDQIRATSTTIRAVLHVGGFGQNDYLKERLRTSLSSAVQILQPPNAWTAVVWCCYDGTGAI